MKIFSNINQSRHELIYKMIALLNRFKLSYANILND